ncbi:MAG: hypothetical protein ACKPE3_09790 [Sphaerospermopsis kisseleviana]
MGRNIARSPFITHFYFIKIISGGSDRFSQRCLTFPISSDDKARNEGQKLCSPI